MSNGNVVRVDRSLDSLVPKLKGICLDINGMIKYHRLPLRVYETGRSVERQRWLVGRGASKTMRSKHLKGRAVDYVVKINGDWSWKKEHHFWIEILAKVVKNKFPELKWGGSFKNFYDFPHYQLRNA